MNLQLWQRHVIFRLLDRIIGQYFSGFYGGDQLGKNTGTCRLQTYTKEQNIDWQFESSLILLFTLDSCSVGELYICRVQTTSDRCRPIKLAV